MIMTKGVRYMLAATFFFSSMNACVKLIPGIPPVEIVFFRSLISLILSVATLRFQKVNLWGHNKKFLILRGAAGAAALILYFTTLQGIPLASAVTIQFLAPIFTAIIGIFMVREYVKPVQWLFFLLAFAGVLVIQGFDARISTFYLVLGIGASLCSGLAHNFIRRMKTSEHPLVIVLYFPLVTLPVTGIISAFNWTTPTISELGILALIGVLTQVAQALMTKSIQLEELSKVAALRYIGIIYALLYGYVLFDENYNFLTYAGMILTLCGVVLNIWYKARYARQRIDQLEE